MILPIQLLSLVLASSALVASSAIQSDASRSLTVPLTRRGFSRSGMSDAEQRTWAKEEGVKLLVKYNAMVGGGGSDRRSAAGTLPLVNANKDASYYGTVGVGTPPRMLNVILDTGSSDLWIASSACGVSTATGCSNVPLFQASASSTFQNTTVPFSIEYGSGHASGELARDTVLMAGFEVQQQTFALCNEVSSALLQNPVSGLMGLAYQTISASGAVPFWEALAKSGEWDQPLMAFFLTRFLNSTASPQQQPGGSFSMGTMDNTLFTGDIDYSSIPAGQQSYWLIELSEIQVNGNDIGLSANNVANAAAIDTGTTLVLGPPAAIAAIFALIPGSVPGTGAYSGYWTYPCDANVSLSLAFGSRSWPISAADFQLLKLPNEPNTCIGALYEGNLGANAPTWIIGDTFLKNVYSVFRYNPPSVGFATLSTKALDASKPGPLPSATLAAPEATITAAASSADLQRGCDRLFWIGASAALSSSLILSRLA